MDGTYQKCFLLRVTFRGGLSPVYVTVVWCFKNEVGGMILGHPFSNFWLDLSPVTLTEV